MKQREAIKKFYDKSNFVNKCVILVVGQGDGRVKEMYRYLEGDRFCA